MPDFISDRVPLGSEFSVALGALDGAFLQPRPKLSPSSGRAFQSGCTRLQFLPSSLAARRFGSEQDGHDVDMAPFAEDVEEDAIVTRAAAERGLGVREVHDVTRKGIDAHAFDRGVDAGEIAGP